MPRLILLIALLLLPACAAGALGSADLAADGGSRLPPDGGLVSLDAGDRGDAGTADATPASRCELSAPLVHLQEQLEPLALGALAVADGERIALAYTRGESARLRLVDRDGAELADGEVQAGEPLQPETLSFGEGRFLLAGKQGSGSGLALFDAAATQLAGGAAADLRPLASLRDGEGGLVLAAKLSGPELIESAVLARVDGAAAVIELLPVGGITRPLSSWDLSAAQGATPRGCGTVADARGEWLASFTLAGGEVAVRASAEPLAPLPQPSTGAAFGCRIAATPALAAVALAETGGAARLLWLGEDGAILGGPVPFLSNFRPARQYDVAMSGTETALAFFDDASGPPRVLARVFASPGGKASDLRLDQGLGLADFTANRVRLVADGDRFLVAFDVAQRGGPTHLIVRAVSCAR